jgi:putative peptidoglycan lipid II flippase
VPPATPGETSAETSAEREGQKERAKLVRRAGVVGAGTLASRLLGLGRDMALAAVFGRGETDAFFVAFTIPNALRQLLAEGAVSSAVVPVLSKTLADEGGPAARAFYARIRAASLLALTVVTVAGVLAARPLTDVFAHGYAADPVAFDRTARMTALVFPYIFFMGTAALGMAALNAEKRFAVAAFAPGLLNVAFLVAAFAFPSVLHAHGVDPAMAMPLGALLGGLLQVAAQWPSLRRLGYLGRPVLDLADPKVRDVFRRMVPMTFGIGVYYVDLILSRRFLSELGEGSQSYFSWAMRLCDFPQGIFVMALSTAALPTLATFAAKGETRELVKTFAHGMSLGLFVAIPASVGLAVLGEPLVVMLFQRGKFDALAASETARALVWQGGAIWTVAAVRQTVPVFYALGDTRTPVVVSALDLLAFVALALLLKGPMGHVGVSVAVAGSSAVQMALLLFALGRKLGGLDGGRIAASAGRTLLASLVAAGGAWGTARILAPFLAGGGLARLLPGGAALAVFGGLFALAAWGLGSEEFESLVRSVRRRLARS